MKIIPFILTAILIGACSDAENKIEDLRDEDEQMEQESNYEEVNKDEETTITPTKEVQIPVLSDSEWSYKVVLISEDNWGYQLIQEGKMIINQKTIPSIQGTNGFDSKEKAERTAKYILRKLENGIFPPAVSKEELDSLDVLRD